jgi:tetratricopeptide (TPR) repeat protein
MEVLKMRIKFAILLFLFALFIYGCVTPGQESFQLGQTLLSQNRVEDAVSMYEDAIAKEPENEEYKNALKKAKALLSGKHAEKARAFLARTPLTFDHLKNAKQETDRALNLAPEDKEIAGLSLQIQSKIEELNKNVKNLYSEASKAAENDEWAAAIKKLKEINTINPGYLDVTLKLKTAESSGASYYIKKADKYKASEDWKNVLEMLSLAQSISPDKPEISAGLKEAKEKNTPEYYYVKASEFSKQNAWDKAMDFVQKAEALGPKGAILENIESIKKDASNFYALRARQNLFTNRFYSAYSDIAAAINYNPDIKEEGSTTEIIQKILSGMYSKAESYESGGQFGNAFILYEKVMKISPDYKDIFYKIQGIKDKIKERVVKKVAIMDFASPTNNAEAGRLVTDSLLSYLTTHASSDVKILARDVLGAILKEIELGQAGLYDIQSAKKAGRLKGTDVFIFGNVLQYNVEKNVTEGYKIANVVVGTRTIQNPSYQTWLMTVRGTPSEEELKNAPPATIKEDIRETIRYKVGTEKKRANLAVSYRVIDVEEGEVVMTQTIKKPLEVSDDYSEGVQQANIPYDPLQLPSDNEIMEKVTNQVVAELGYAVLSRFQNLQILYSNSAELLKKKREYEKAIEKYVDAIQVEEMKNISGPLSEKAKKEIEELLKVSLK